MALPSERKLLEWVEAMAGQRVPMLVDLVADRFIEGTPKRISREAPVLILRQDSLSLAPGGGANAVANVAALGGRPLPLGLVGDDEAGRGVVAALMEMGVDCRGIRARPDFRTPTKTRVLAGARHSVKQQVVRFDLEDTVAPDEADRAHFAAALAAAAAPATVGVVSDYGYGTVTAELLGLLREHLAPAATLVGDSRYRLATLHGLDAATPNEEEAEALAGRRLDGEPAACAREIETLRQHLGMPFLLVTRGRHGMILTTGEGAATIPVHGTDQVADVTGAGDTVIGTFALALAAGAPPLEAALLADYAGGIVVRKLGTASVHADELRQAIVDDAVPREECTWVAWSTSTK